MQILTQAEKRAIQVIKKNSNNFTIGFLQNALNLSREHAACTVIGLKQLKLASLTKQGWKLSQTAIATF